MLFELVNFCFHFDIIFYSHLTRNRRILVDSYNLVPPEGHSRNSIHDSSENHMHTTGMSSTTSTYQELKLFLFIGACLEGFFWGMTVYYTVTFRDPANTVQLSRPQDSTLPYSPCIYSHTYRRESPAIKRKRLFSILTVLCMFYLVLPLPSI